MISRQACASVVPLVFLLAAAPVRATPRVQDKSAAPQALQRLIAVQDDVMSRRSVAGVHLARRSLEPAIGAERALSQRAISAENPALVIARLAEFPTAASWEAWGADGIARIGYLGNRHWLLRIETSAELAFRRMRAAAFIAYRTDDKITPSLDTPDATSAFYEADTGRVVVNVTLDRPDPSVSRSLREAFHRDTSPFVDESGGRTVTLVTAAGRMAELARLDAVIAIQPGQWERELLMDGVRVKVQADRVIGKLGHLLTGAGVRAATNELLGLGRSHEDYFTHDANGDPTFERFTPLASGTCVHSIHKADHGQMTAGILLGNGWQSERNGGQPFAFRGIAPEATFECYGHADARAHVSSHSYESTELTTETHWDAAIVGDGTISRHHAHVGAGGNSGIARPDDHPGEAIGYFSLRNNAKNAMIVANAQVNGHIHPTNSSGPTFDGRIKPDIAAPTRNHRPELDEHGVSVEISSMRLLRGNQELFEWTFEDASPNWHQGWGHTDSIPGFGQIHLTASQSNAGNLLLDVAPKPWGEMWQITPLVGTQIVPFDHPFIGGQPLNIQGEEADVLEIRYRSIVTDIARTFDYFHLNAVWMREFPPQTSSDWHSQSAHSAVGLADGLWHTLHIPVGLATDIFLQGNPSWPPGETWANNAIRYLALRFNQFDFQPTTLYPQNYQRSGGTSGASPVVGGAYALAMEHLVALYQGVNLDDKHHSSVYVPDALPPYGMPNNATWKALFVHTARDMTDILADGMSLPDNPDLGEPTVYHAGPDYTSGYGMLKVQSAINLMTNVAKGGSLYELIESRLQSNQLHIYEIEVGDRFAFGPRGLKATLAWDDPPAYGSTSEIEPKLVNNLGLLLLAPDGSTYHPWSIDLPYAYDETNGPHVLEPQPITAADIVPARRDMPNDRDNLEQVQVDDVDTDQTGIWRIIVVDNGMGVPSLAGQEYSLIISPWRASKGCHDC